LIAGAPQSANRWVRGRPPRREIGGVGPPVDPLIPRQLEGREGAVPRARLEALVKRHIPVAGPIGPSKTPAEKL